MTYEHTLSIIKPDAIEKGCVGAIIDRIEKAGLRVVAQKMTKITLDQAERFYAVHKGRPFYNALCSFMASGPIVAMVLEGPNAIETYRRIMGDTNPLKAVPGTIRGDFCKGVTDINRERNAVHGSDAVETARMEIPFFFTNFEIYSPTL